MLKVTMYTDGAAKGNPGPGGYGIVILMKDEEGKVTRHEYSNGYKNTTNNRMELLAVIVGLECLPAPSEVIVISDSKYVTEAFNQGWLARWIKNGWRTATNKPVKNLDLWQRMVKAIKPHNVEFQWIKGHSEVDENNHCDILAYEAAEAAEKKK